MLRTLTNRNAPNKVLWKFRKRFTIFTLKIILLWNKFNVMKFMSACCYSCHVSKLLRKQFFFI